MIPKLNRKRTRLLVAVLHGLMLFICLRLVNNTSYSTSADEALLGKIDIMDQLIFPGKAKLPYDFVFINVSKDITLLDDPVDYGSIAITDRDKLAAFFKILAGNNNRHRFVLCDVFFENPSSADTALMNEVSVCRNIIFPSHLVNDSLVKPCIPVPSALANYETYTGKFIKFRLMYNDSVKTIPLLLHEKFDKPKKKLLPLSFAAIPVDYRIRPYQLFKEKTYPYYNLGELLALSGMDSFYSQFLENKFIVIGNFDTDVHSTPAGKVPGPLILLNTWLTLREGKNTASIWWAITMVAGFSFISYILFFGKIKPPELKDHPWLYLFLNSFINKYFSFFGIMVVLVFISEILFSVQTSTSFILVYVLFVNFILNFYKKHFQKEKEKEAHV